MNGYRARVAIPAEHRPALRRAGWLDGDDPTAGAAALLAEAARGPDPEGTLARLARLLDADPVLGRDAAADPGLGRPLVAVAGASRALSAVAAERPGAFREVSSGARQTPVFDTTGGAGALRRAVREALLGIAARDLTGAMDMPAVGAALAEVADLAAAAALEIAGEAAAGRGLPRIPMTVVAMGKWGGRELNYASDIDVLFVYDVPPDIDPAIAGEAARAVAGGFLETLGGHGPDGIAFRVDANLRPEGRSGPLARTVDSYRAYWERWAETWELQAMLKARPAAGDPALGARLLEAAEPFVFPETLGAEAVASIRAMKVRTEQLAGEELKRGVGGIRDIEFAVQLLQLVHGRSDPLLRHANTLDALAVLHDAGYVRPGDAATLSEAYRWLRDVEHRIQLVDLRQSHQLPEDAAGRERIAKAMGYRDEPAATALEQFERDLVERRAAVRTIHERLFYRPLLEAFADSPAVRLGVEGAARQLAALGFLDAPAARRALGDLTAGLSRRSRLMQQLLPLMMDWLSDAPDPDLGLEQLRLLVTSTADNAQLVGALRDSPVAAERLCRLLGTGRLLARLLDRIPAFLPRLGDDRALATFGSRSDLVDEALAGVTVRESAEARAGALRRFVARRILWAAAADVSGLIGETAVGTALSDTADAAAEAALWIARREVPDAPPMAVIAAGKWGGRELNYASDLDALLVFDPGDGDPDAAEAASRVATRLVAALRADDTTPGFGIDLGLRPEGKRGAPARSLASYRAYYERWADTWEFQALLRARPAAGDPGVGAGFAELVEPFVYRDDFGEAETREVRRMKVRVERERILPSEDPDFHMKLGRGGMADVEWTVQLLQLQHGAAEPSIRSPGTREALTALTAAGLLTAAEAGILDDAYRFCARVRNRLFLQAGRQRDSLPADTGQTVALARSLGYRLNPRTSLREEYRRVTRRARRVVERRFFGEP